MTIRKIQFSELNSLEQLAIFRQLLKDPVVRKKADAAAQELFATVDIDTVADKVIRELDKLELEELFENSGRTRHGYVDVHELSWTMFGDAVQPFSRELSRLVKHGLFRQAKLYCMGVLKGMKRYEQADSDFSEWIPDAASEYSEEIFNLWMKHADKPDIVEMEKFRQTLSEAGI